MGSRHAVAGLLALLGFALPACSASTGVPAAPAALESLVYDSGEDAIPAEASAPPALFVSVTGSVRRGADAGAAGALVVASVGGLGPEGGTATLDTNAALRFGVAASDAGAFALTVPAGLVGLHVFDPGYLEGKSLVRTASSPDAGATATLITLVPLPTVDAGKLQRPTAKGLTISSASSSTLVSYVVPSEPVAFAVEVTSAKGDPLSDDVVLVQPTTGWAAALAPPTPAVPGGAYPDGVYSLLVAAPATLGVFTYTVVVASVSGVPSEPTSVVLHVTDTGVAPLFDGGGE